MVHGGRRLEGHIDVDSAKNAILPIIAATLLTKGKVVLHRIPKISDVDKMLNIIKHMGGKVTFCEEGVVIDNTSINTLTVPKELTSGIRSSIFILGAMLSMYKKAIVAYPGGCAIGLRPVGIHLFGLRELGVKIREDSDFIDCDGGSMHSNTVRLDFPSVGATENVMMAAVLLKGDTIIQNAAKEPEIIDLANFINTLGGKIEGAGTHTIRIQGVKRLHGGEYTPIGDRIIAGTYMIAGAMTKGHIELSNAKYEDNLALIDKLKKSGCNVDFFGGKIIMDMKYRPKSCSFTTGVFPGFPTDLQPQLSTMCTIAHGVSDITENLFETRFKHFEELKKMGAKVECFNKSALVIGVNKLYGAEVVAQDLRGGAALVLAGLVAEGETLINNTSYIDRGYDNIEGKLKSLGAEIKRV